MGSEIWRRRKVFVAGSTGLLGASEKLLAGQAHGEAYNFSNEVQITVRELVALICPPMGAQDLEPVVLNEASNEIPHQYLSAEKATRELGWKPTYTLKEGLL